MQEKKKREREEGEEDKEKLLSGAVVVATLPSRPLVPLTEEEKIELAKAEKAERAKKAANSKEGRAKRQKKNDRKRALRRAANENPLIERIKQGWEVPQRNRATAALLRFGFGRFCKIRHESNLTSLPLQDLEIFTRACAFVSLFGSLETP